MYRLYGIPARYATGYMVQPSEFKVNDEEEFYAEATGENAHAWVEIFLEDYGWTPVEVTPASDGSAAVSYSGFDGLKYAQLTASHDWDIPLSSVGAATAETAVETVVAEKRERLLDLGEIAAAVPWERLFGFMVFALSCAVFAVLMIPFYLSERRQKRLKRYAECGSAESFSRALHALHFAGIMRGYCGSETDFGQRLSGEFSDIPQAEISAFIRAANHDSFGNSELSDAENHTARTVSEIVCKAVYERLSVPEKFVFKFIKEYI